MNEVAVVILNYNGAHYLLKFLPTVIKYSQPCRIVVADNSSTDNSVEIMKKEFPQVELVELPQNFGFSEGYNQALKLVKAKFYVLLNSDVEVTSNWWQSSIKILSSSGNIAAVQPKILSYNEKNKFEYAGAGGGFIDKLGYPFCRGRIFISIEEDHHQYDDVVQIFWASGACLFIKSELYHKMGGFNPEFFAHMEEIDLCWRLQKAGYKIIYNGGSHVYHVGGGTLERSHPRKTYLNFRNGLSLLYLNYSNTQLISLLPLRIILDWIAALKFTLFDSKHHGMAVFRAHKFFFRNLKVNSKKRKLLRSLGNETIDTIYPGSIVYEHFLKGKKYFRELKFHHKINKTTQS